MLKKKFKVVSHVTVPVLKIDGSRPVYLKMMEPIHMAPENDKQKAIREKLTAEGKQVKPVPEIVKVTNLEDDKVYQVVCNEVFRSELRQNYPGDTYVGKAFAVNKFAPAGNQQYATFQIAEIELEDDAQETGEPEGEEQHQDAAPEARGEAEAPAEGEQHHGGRKGRKAA